MNITTEQADKIISLLEEINAKLPELNSNTLDDIYSEIGWVKSSVDDLKREIKNLK